MGPGLTPRRILAAVAIVTLLATVTSSAAAAAQAPRAAAPEQPAAAVGPFPDVAADSPFAEAIAWAADNGVTTGRPDGTFGPTATLDRQSFAAFLARYWVSPGVPETCTTAPFPDVATTHPLCPTISWLATRDITTGTPDGRFAPNRPVTRQELAAFLHRLRGTPPGPGCDNPPFTDVTTTHPFCEPIAWLADVAITTGNPDGTYAPTRTVNRQEAVTFLARIDPGCAPATARPGCPRPAVDGDYDGDRTADPVWWTETARNDETGLTTIEWFDGDATEPFQTLTGTWPEVLDGDYDGDGRWEPASLHGGAGADFAAPGPGTSLGQLFPELPSCAPLSSMTPIVGDWDGDRRDELGWWCGGDATWHLPGREPVAFGTPDPGTHQVFTGELYSVPAPADYDGDGVTDIATYEPVDGTVQLRTAEGATTIASGFGFGLPVTGDVDGDGEEDVLVHSLFDDTWELPGGERVAPSYGPVPEGDVFPLLSDRDGDGDSDLGAGITGYSATTSWYLSTGADPVQLSLPEQGDPSPYAVPTVVRPHQVVNIIRLFFLGRECSESVSPPPYEDCPRTVP